MVVMARFLATCGETASAMRPSFWRRALVSAFAFTLVAGVASFASASCGDWLANPGHSMGKTAMGKTAMGKTAHANQPAESSQPLASRTPAKPPCDGPMCQKAPVAPSPAVPATVLERADKNGVSLHTVANDLSAWQFGSSDWDARPSKGFPFRLEHPPRA
jgi:hypothetical protein